MLTRTLNLALALSLTALTSCTTSGNAAGGAASATQAATSSGGDTSSSVTFRNRSNWAILNIYMSPVSQATWGPDQLGAHILRTGENYTLNNVPCNSYDLKLVDEDHDECILNNVNICNEESGWTIDNDDLLSCQAFTRRQQGQ
ncbi:MAG: hypothetical protein U0324_02325 [Polyangiales bacterium]